MAKIYNPRLKAPNDTNRYYIKTTYGGYNKCIQIQFGGSVLPNCTGYAYGRFMECQGVSVTTCNLSTGNAENWYYKNDGYERGQDPKLGAVICWSDSEGEGHVAIVEKINKDGTILTSNSAYNGSRFYLKTLDKANNYYMGSTYSFQGFIYNPTNFNDPDNPIQEEKKKGFKWVLYARRLREKRKKLTLQ